MTAKKWPTREEFLKAIHENLEGMDDMDLWAYDYLTQFAAPEVPGEVREALSDLISDGTVTHHWRCAIHDDATRECSCGESAMWNRARQALKSLEGCREAVGEDEIERLVEVLSRILGKFDWETFKIQSAGKKEWRLNNSGTFVLTKELYELHEALAGYKAALERGSK